MAADLARRTRGLDELVRSVSTQFPLLASVTPTNASAEQVRLEAAWSRGLEASPRWIPPAIDRLRLARLRGGLDDAIGLLSRERSDPWLRLYHGRLVELAHELAIVDAAFGPRIGDAASARFGDGEDDAAAALERQWIDERVSASVASIATDDETDPRSLVARMKQELAARRLGVRVVVRERIGALAAAGDGIVVVAAGRLVDHAETERVVLHEIEGHVLPRERARGEGPGIVAIGSAGASEDEEGRALLLEDRAGLLGARRRRNLAARHRATRKVLAGASFVEVVRDLRSVELPIDEALAIAARVMRGAHVRGADVASGLARERIYLPAYLRIRRASADDPGLVERLGTRRLSLAAWRILG
jgi:hypothetical protein